MSGKQEPVVDVQGTVEDGFEPVRDAFMANFARRGERGAAVAVYRHGRKVVDLWGGTKDGDAGKHAAGAALWEAGTAQVIRSATKGIAALVPLLLHQRGQLDLDAPVGTYWPEFKAAGKERVLVRHLLSHRAGLPALDTPLTPGQAIDGVSGPAALAAQAPFWEPGTDHGYHAQTYSWLIGELVLRVTGRSVGSWIADEIAGPLGLDLWVGLPEAAQSRVGRVAAVAAPAPPAATGLRARRSRPSPTPTPIRTRSPVAPSPRSLRRPTRTTRLPGRRAARLRRYRHRPFAGPLLRRAHRGRRRPPRLFAPATLTLARTEESAGPDRTLLVPTRFGLGFMLHGPASPLLAPGSFGHPGRGGALACADPETGLAFGYVTNGMQRNVTADPRAQALLRAVSHVAVPPRR
ncbi:serine hydrolase [Streptomyces lydicus]|nr:serine hydrolase [Streptomyces lydicus]